MTKQEWIEQYIVNFMATADANSLDWHSGKVLTPCKYERALREAERAYKSFNKEHNEHSKH